MKAFSIYFLQGEQSRRIKIGYAECPNHRKRTIQHQCTELLTTIGIIEIGTCTRYDAEAREMFIQTLFKDSHAYGEIFNEHPSLLQFISDHAQDPHHCALCPLDSTPRNPWNRRSGNKGKPSPNAKIKPKPTTKRRLVNLG